MPSCLGARGLHQDRRRGAVGELRGVARRDAAVGLEGRLEGLGRPSSVVSGRLHSSLRTTTPSSIVTRAVLGLDGALHGDRRDALVEPALLLGQRDALLTLECVGVLILARDLVALGHDLGGHAHPHVEPGQLRVHLRVHHVLETHLVVLHQRDRFGAAADRDVGAVDQDPMRGHRDRLEPRGAVAVHGGAGHRSRQARREQRHARDVVPGRALGQPAAEDHVLDLGRVEIRHLRRAPTGSRGRRDRRGGSG